MDIFCPIRQYSIDGGKIMNEKIYKTMKSVGVGNLVLGICIIAFGIGIGVTTIVNGGRLLSRKSHILF